MGLEIHSLPRIEVMRSKFRGSAMEVGDVVIKPSSFCEEDAEMNLRSCGYCEGALKESLIFKNWERANDVLEKNRDSESYMMEQSSLKLSPRPKCDRDAAAVKLQKVYKSYRTRRNLADCAVVIEELWWKAVDFASLKHSSITFFDSEKPESAVSRWARARTRAAKVGKGLSKNEKAQKLSLQHWLEAIDPRHRYGHNLHLYYNVWFESSSSEPFFYWLDIGEGKEVNLEKCPRNKLQQQCIKYLGPKEREEYEVIVENGKLVYKESRVLVNTDEGSKWIFVLSTSKALYVGQKKKGSFQHSSFLAGGAITAAGRLVVKDGILKAVWPYSGHYLPTEENFQEFIKFLRESNVDLTCVKRCPIDEDDRYPSFKNRSNESPLEVANTNDSSEDRTSSEHIDSSETESEFTPLESTNTDSEETENVESPTARLSRKWTTGAGPRITCVRDYPSELQFKALEHVNLSPKVDITSPNESKGPIPSPRPSPRLRLSPRLASMGLPTPTISLTLPKPKKR